MSVNIIQEIDFLWHAFLLGALITFGYDWIRIARRVIPHNLFFISLEDLIFWIVCSVRIFLMLYEENNGTLRWFAVIGAMIGMFLYKLCIGRFLVKYVSCLLNKMIGMLEKLLHFMGIPLKRIAVKGRSVSRKIRHWFILGKKIWKNRLTALKKMVKIILCKQ